MKTTRYDLTFLKPDNTKLFLTGLTVSEAHKEINKLLKEYYLYDANCSITVVNSLYSRPAKVNAFVRSRVSITNKITKFPVINNLQTEPNETLVQPMLSVNNITS